MPLYIRDSSVDDLAEQLRVRLGARTKTDAVRTALEHAFRPDLRMIPAVDGTHALQPGEHRKVLALMLLTWPERLHPGPNLPDYEAWRKLQPIAQ